MQGAHKGVAGDEMEGVSKNQSVKGLYPEGSEEPLKSKRIVCTIKVVFSKGDSVSGVADGEE